MGMDVEQEIQDINNRLAEQFKVKYCPNCHETSLLVRTNPSYNNQYRCISCLALLNLLTQLEVVEPVCVKLGEK